MQRINHTFEKLASATRNAASLAIVFACLTLGGETLFAASICDGGSVVKDSTSGNIVGCAFSTWGTAQQSMCNGATVFTGPNPKNCHICVTAQYATQVAADNFSGLSLIPNAGATNAPADFHCLKCTPPPDGLTAWWTLDEPAGTTAVHDLTGNLRYDGVRYGATAVPGHDAALGADVRNANHFNGVNEYIEIPQANTQLDVGSVYGPVPSSCSYQGSFCPGDFSIDAWVKIDQQDAAWIQSSRVRVIVEKRTYNQGSYVGYSFYLYNGYLGLQMASPGFGVANYGAPALTVPADGQWHLVATSVRRFGAEVHFFLDGADVQDLPANGVPANSLANLSPLRIGMGTVNNGSDAFKGSIDEVEFFQTFVTSADFNNIYHAKCYGKCK